MTGQRESNPNNSDQKEIFGGYQVTRDHEGRIVEMQPPSAAPAQWEMLDENDQIIEPTRKEEER